MQRGILWLILAAFAVSLAGGCVLTMRQPFLKERKLDKGIIPDISGRWTDQEGATLTITKTEFTNTFEATGTNPNEVIRVSVERLDDTKFIVQLKPKGPEVEGEGVFLTVGEVSPKRLVLYFFKDNLPVLQEKAKANGVTISGVGLITKYETAQGIIAFFREMAVTPGHVDFVITKK
ncbi:MAG: hypothetical protein LBF40_09520 [Deltaproteobacteria bacterium]|nr:hypothetical protein [Deltaproteobacteria bacterium]